MFRRFTPRFISAVLLCSLLLGAAPVGVAFATCDDSTVTTGNDTVICDVDPPPGEENLGLDLGDDTYTQDAGATTNNVGGDALNDGSASAADGGNDTITIVGDVLFVVSGDATSQNGGDDTITIAGDVGGVMGDDAGLDGGDDVIIIDGTASGVLGDSSGGNGGDDIIIINGLVSFVEGDLSGGDGGDDIIIINGTAGDVIGDNVGGIGGNDTIYIYGTVNTVCGDCAGVDGDDTVILGVNAEVIIEVNGQGGTDVLKFAAISQKDLDALGLDPAGGTITLNGHTYTWLNFESLIGLLQQIAEERGLRIYYRSNSLLATESEDHLGISVFAEHGRIAFISFESAANLGVGESATYSTPNAAGWYVAVINLGASVVHPGHTLYQVNIYSPGGALAGQFTFVN
jgi:hypothetical protein